MKYTDFPTIPNNKERRKERRAGSAVAFLPQPKAFVRFSITLDFRTGVSPGESLRPGAAQ